MYKAIQNNHALFLSTITCHLFPPFSLHSSTLAAIFSAQPCQARSYISAFAFTIPAACNASPAITTRLAPSRHSGFSPWP